jgi:cytochrome P450
MKSLHDIPMLSGQSFGGHAAEFRRLRGDFFLRMHAENGAASRLRFFNVEALSVASPELVHDVLVEKAKSFDKTLALKMAFYPLAGKGLFTSEGDLWKRQRKLIAPLFSPAAVKSYADAMNAVIDRYLDTWKDGDVIDAGREMTRITMAVVGKVLFDSDTFDDADELGAAIQVMFGHLTDQGASLALILRATAGVQLLELGELPAWADQLRARAIERLSQPLPWPTAKRRRLFAAVATLDRKMQEMIDERRRSGSDNNDLLTRLLKARDEDDGTVMTDRQIRDEAVTLFVAGHETTATTTTWALHFLSRHPDVYRRWKQEAAGLGGRAPSADDAGRLVYTAGIFKEAARLYPPAFMLDRVSLEDVEVGGYRLPRHTVVFICPYSMHRRPELWPDPERFDPERFTPEAEARRPRLAWIPFGAGPRVCIGAGFAMLEAQILLARIAQRFELDAVDHEPMGVNFLSALHPSRPVKLRVKRIAEPASVQALAS